MIILLVIITYLVAVIVTTRIFCWMNYYNFKNKESFEFLLFNLFFLPLVMLYLLIKLFVYLSIPRK